MDIKSITIKLQDNNEIKIDLSRPIDEVVKSFSNSINDNITALNKVVITEDNKIQEILMVVNGGKFYVNKYQVYKGLVVYFSTYDAISLTIIENEEISGDLSQYDNIIDIELTDDTHTKLSDVVSLITMTYNLKSDIDMESSISDFNEDAYKLISLDDHMSDKEIKLKYKIKSKKEKSKLLFSTLEIRKKIRF